MLGKLKIQVASSCHLCFSSLCAASEALHPPHLCIRKPNLEVSKLRSLQEAFRAITAFVVEHISWTWRFRSSKEAVRVLHLYSKTTFVWRTSSAPCEYRICTRHPRRPGDRQETTTPGNHQDTVRTTPEDHKEDHLRRALRPGRPRRGQQRQTTRRHQDHQETAPPGNHRKTTKPLRDHQESTRRPKIPPRRGHLSRSVYVDTPKSGMNV